MPLTLRDLARQVGVHPSTVSRVLNGDPSARLAEDTRRRILEHAAATGYRPNRLARSLKTQRTGILGMLIPDITNPFFSSMFRAVEDTAGPAGYNVILCNTDDCAHRLQQHLRTLSDGHVDAVIIATAHREDAAIGQLRERALPYVLVNRRRDLAGDSFVVPDDRNGVRSAVAHLVALGHTRIAHIAGSEAISTTATRRDAFGQAMGELGLSVPPRYIVEGGLTEASGEAAMRALLALPAGERPTAVFAVNDLAALGAIAACEVAGVRVPEDVSVVGFNDIPLAGRSRPALTTLRVPVYEMGQRAAEILLERLAGPPRVEGFPPIQVVMPTKLIVRGSTSSTAAPAASAPATGERDTHHE